MYRNIPEVMTFRECCELLKIGKNTMLESAAYTAD